MDRQSLCIKGPLVPMFVAAVFLAGCAPVVAPTVELVRTVETEQVVVVEAIATATPEEGPQDEDSGIPVEWEDVYDVVAWPQPELCHPVSPKLVLATGLYTKEVESPYPGGYSVAVQYVNSKGQEFWITIHGLEESAVQDYLQDLRLCLEAIEVAETAQGDETAAPAAVEAETATPTPFEELENANDLLITVDYVLEDPTWAALSFSIYYIFDPRIGDNTVHNYTCNLQRSAIVWIYVTMGKVGTILRSLAGPGIKTNQYMSVEVSELKELVDPPKGGLNPTAVKYRVIVDGLASSNVYKIGGGWNFVGTKFSGP